MALTIHRLADQAGAGPTADRRLYLDASGTTLIEEGDPRAATLLVGAGQAIPADVAARLGLEVVDGAVRQAGIETKPGPTIAVKADAPAAGPDVTPATSEPPAPAAQDGPEGADAES